MITDDKFYGLVQFLLHRAMDFRLEMAAMKVALEAQFPGFSDRVDQTREKLSEVPGVAEFRAYIDELDIEEALQAFAKYEGPVQ